MTKVNRDVLVRRVFCDPKNYPYGFSRSGDFSIAESKALAEYGCIIAALVDGQISCETPEDQGYLAAAFGQKEPENPIERAWVKYQKRINRPKMGSINNSRVIKLDSEEELLDDEIDVDSDIEMTADD
jgi:uncharacterized protein YifE (UPF0438 family)